MGITKTLSKLRGNYVLLDFWASWCGPCRAENPNVVRNYRKYKDKGFTVMSVSLDTDRTKWLAAIKKDGLEWPNHVSELKGWQTSVLPNYGINSIPYTVLIDKEGKIIQTNLRGPALEAKLKEIFGY
jgi:thiol-disulfide isomerase/thioredoxin